MTVPQVIATLGTVFLLLSFLAVLIHGWPGRRSVLSPQTGQALKGLLDEVENILATVRALEDEDGPIPPPEAAVFLRRLRVAYERLQAHALEDLSS